MEGLSLVRCVVGGKTTKSVICKFDIFYCMDTDCTVTALGLIPKPVNGSLAFQFVKRSIMHIP